MSPYLRWFWLRLFVPALFALPAQEWIGRTVYPSVEFVVAQARDVVLGKIVSMSETPDALNQFELEIEVTEVLKGSSQKRVILHVPEWQFWTSTARRRAEVIVCTDFRLGELGTMDMAARSAGFADAFGTIVYDLSSEHPYTYSMDFRRLRKPADVLQAVRAAAKFVSPKISRTAEYMTIPLTSDQENLKQSYGMTDLMVPVDLRLEALAEKWMHSPNVAMRKLAVRALSQLLIESSTKLLRELLNDPTYDVEAMSYWDKRIDFRARRHYSIRQLAQQALLRRAVAAEAELERPDMIYAAPRWGYAVAGIIFIVGLAILMGGRRIGRCISAGLALLAIGACIMWWRSAHVLDCASLATVTTEHEISSFGGKVSWLRVIDHPSPHGWLLSNVRMAGGGIWYEHYLMASHQTGRAGFLAAQGGVPAGRFAIYRYELTAVPYWAIAGTLGAWPLASMFASLHFRVRQRRWGRSNRCRQCGYDLRGLDGRCPECGTGREAEHLPFSGV